MELEIVSKKDNLLLDRIELEVLLRHIGEPTPKRDDVRETVAASQKAEKGRVVVDHLDPTFGMGVTRGYVKVYSTKQAALAVEEEPIKKRNKLEARQGTGQGAGQGTGQGTDRVRVVRTWQRSPKNLGTSHR